MSVTAKYFDGQQAGSTEVQLSLEMNNLRFVCDGHEQHHSVESVTVTPPVGRGDWVFELPNGGSLTVADESFASRVYALKNKGNWIGALEQRWHWAVLALVLSVIFTWATLTYGIPAAARQVAYAVPDDIANDLSSGGMELLDKVMFAPSELDDAETKRVTDLFEEIQQSDPGYANYRLELRSSQIGPNAFAVPGGIVVMTDELVELAISDDELLAVLAHEVGHLHERHSLRILLQDSTSAVLIASITGDISNITALSAAIPTLLMQAKYSRDFEREADEFAFDYLDSRGIDDDVLSELLIRMESEVGADGETALDGWFSTHPPSEERIDDDE